jgi:heme oxygenase
MSPNSLVSELRAATSDLHRELDGSLGLAQGHVTLLSYVAFLRGSLAALDPLEERLRASLTGTPRSRCALLREDLIALGADTTVCSLPEVPSLQSEAAVFGARYVIEGSALGGAVLARSFDASLRLEGEALGYLTLYGSSLGEHWRAFVSELESFGKRATRSMRSEACETAQAVFKLYAAGFRSTGATAIGK